MWLKTVVTWSASVADWAVLPLMIFPRTYASGSCANCTYRSIAYMECVQNPFSKPWAQKVEGSTIYRHRTFLWFPTNSTNNPRVLGLLRVWTRSFKKMYVGKYAIILCALSTISTQGRGPPLLTHDERQDIILSISALALSMRCAFMTSKDRRYILWALSAEARVQIS